MSRFQVHMGYTPADEPLAHLRAALSPHIDLTTGSTPPDPATYQVLVAGRPSPELLAASPDLTTLLIPFAGLPAITAERLQAYPKLRVHNLHYNAIPTAEMALALLLAVARRLIPSDRDFRRHDWTPRYQPYPSVMLHGKRALIVGYGAVGHVLGELLRALGMTVHGIRRRHAHTAQGIYTTDALPHLLPQTDALIICLPATPQTDSMFGAEEFALLPPGAMVINVGRAAVIDQAALYDALKSGHLHGAAQDVWVHYPATEADRTHTPPADVPFHELDNMVLSPHRAGGGGNPEIEIMRMTALADSLNRAARGDSLPHRVDLTAGY